MSKSKRTRAPRLEAANLAGITTLMNPQHLKPGADLVAAEKSIMGKNTSAVKKMDGDPVKSYTTELNRLAEELGIDLLDEPRQLVGGGHGPPPNATESRASDPKSSDSRAAEARAGAEIVLPKRPQSLSVANLIDDLQLDDNRKAPSGSHRKKSYSSGSDSSSDSDSDSGSDSGSASGSSYTGSSYTGSSRSGSSYTGSSRSGSYTGSSYTGSSRSGSSYTGSSRSGSSRSGSTRSGSTHNETKKSSTHGDDDKVDRIISRLETDLGIGAKKEHTEDRARNHGREHGREHGRDHGHDHGHDHGREHGRHRHEDEHYRSKTESHDADTDEQRRRRHINSVVSDIRGETRTSFGVEAERVQDLKASKLEQIGQLRMTLEEEGIDCGSVGNPTSASQMAEIDSVLNILRLKNDRNRYSSLAEEVILGMAEGIETVFDGTREVPILGWKPDYTGYNATINVKLHRMRFETSQVVGNIIQRFNIGPTSRIIMELLPSFFLYPRQQKKQRGTPGLSNDPHIADARHAINAIRMSDERRSIDEVRDL